MLSAAARGFGIDISSSIEGVSYEISVDGTVVVPTVPVVAGTTPVFFGLRTDSAIAQIVIRAIGGATNGTESYFDGAAIGEAQVEEPPPPSETPEPSTIIFLGTGLALLAWTRNRRSASQVS